MDIAEKVLLLKQDFDDVKAAGYESGYNDGISAGGGGSYNEGFEAGKKAEYDAFWDAFQDPTTRTNYFYTFASNAWNSITYNPKYPIVPNNNDGAGNGIGFAYWYNTRITDTKVSITAAGNAKRAFYQCKNLVAIPGLIFDGVTDISDAFRGCAKLETLICGGSLDISGLNLSDCTKLTHDSLMSVINCLAPTSTTLTATFGSTNLAKLSADEIKIATDKGWSLG